MPMTATSVLFIRYPISDLFWFCPIDSLVIDPTRIQHPHTHTQMYSTDTETQIQTCREN